MRFLLFALCLGATACSSFREPLKPASPSAEPSSYTPRVRHYYVAAEVVKWNYAPSKKNQIHTEDSMSPWSDQLVYDKLRYIEYTDDTFKTKKDQPAGLGIFGPVIRAVVGDTLKVHLLNRTKQGVNMHPHGVFYDKDNEGAHYAHIPGKGQIVRPGESYVYTWNVPERAGPAEQDVSSVAWLYHGHDHEGKDIYKGLLGPMVVTNPKFAKEDGSPKDIDRELFTLFMIFNENRGDKEDEGHLKHAINGRIFGNLEGLDMYVGEKVRWYLYDMGNEVDLHTPHWHGTTVVHEGRRKDVIELLPASMTTADMIADNPGTWMFHCHVSDHIEAGMVSLYRILQPEKKVESAPK